MDTPEQPTIWPPAPTIAPPKREKSPRFALFLPEWLAYILKESALPSAAAIGTVISISLINHQPLPNRKDYSIIIGTILIFNGIKYWKKVKRQRNRTRL
jgi:hypothetical protein